VKLKLLPMMKPRMIKIALLIFSFLLFVDTADGKTINKHRRFSSEKLDEYRSSNTFVYYKGDEYEKDFYTSYLLMLKDLLGKMFSSKVADGIVSNLDIILLATAMLVIMIYIRRMKTQGVFVHNANITAGTVAGVVSNGENIDYDKLISTAVAEKNYRLAVRYQYLKILRKLHSEGLIKFKPYKTNYQYVNEIKDESIRNDFAGAAKIYEFIWYGRRNIDNDIYNQLQNEYFNKLSGGKF